MAVTTPTINKIYKMTEFDLARTSYTPGNMYICLDSYKLYYDESVNTRVMYDYVSVSTVNDLRHNITPDYGKTYYCWEDNSLWLWINKWITLWSDSTYPSAYVYDDWSGGNLTSIYRHDQPLLSADDNGLLHDGSVVVRDRNRIIKGRVYVDDGNDNFVISSFLGGGLRFLPNGQMTTNGEFLIDERTAEVEGSENTVTIPAASLRAEFRTKNYEMFVDYTEEPEMDMNPYSTDEHIYQVYHTGNLDAAALHVLTPQEVYQKLKDPSLPATLDLSVARLNGLDASNYSLITHTHTHEAITDFNSAARDQASIEIGTIFNGATTRGIALNYNVGNKKLSLVAKSYSINLTGDGISGSATVGSDRNNVDIIVQVNPDGHAHQDYIDRMDRLQLAIDNINVMDPDDYYTKPQTDSLVQSVAGTATPTTGRPLLVNDNGILPGTADEANQLSTARTLTFTGAVTGQLTTNFDGDETITLSSTPILSNIPTLGKALAVTLNEDNELVLDGLASTAKQLDHTVNIDLLGDVTGSTNWNTADNQIEITTVLSESSEAYDKLLLKSHIGSLVPGLDNVSHIIPDTYIDDKYRDKLTFKDYYAPRQHPTTQEWLPPTDSALQGDFYILTADGRIGDVNYVAGDWTIYLAGGWVRLSTSSDVWSVNGKNGTVVLDYVDVGAISSDLVDYTIEPIYEPDPETGDPVIVGYTEIPRGKVVVAYDNGEIHGAGVERLIEPITISSDDSSEISILNTSTSTSATGAPGNDYFGLNMQITQAGFESILDNVGHEIQSTGTTLDHKRYLNFDDSFIITELDTSLKISLSSDSTNTVLYMWYKTAALNNLDYIKTAINTLYSNLEAKSIILLCNYTDTLYKLVMDLNTPEIDDDGNITVYSDEVYDCSVNGTTSISSSKIKMVLSFSFVIDEGQKVIDELQSVSLTKIDSNYGTFLSTQVSGTEPTAFVPTRDWQPTTKKYVDDAISAGQGSQVEYYTSTLGAITKGTTTTITHNLNTQAILVQFRYTSTGEQVILGNAITGPNTITVTPDMNVADATIFVSILALK